MAHSLKLSLPPAAGGAGVPRLALPACFAESGRADATLSASVSPATATSAETGRSRLESAVALLSPRIFRSPATDRSLQDFAAAASTYSFEESPSAALHMTTADGSVRAVMTKTKSFVMAKEPFTKGGEKTVAEGFMVSPSDSSPLPVAILRPNVESGLSNPMSMLRKEAYFTRLLQDSKDPRKQFVLDSRIAEFDDFHIVPMYQGDIITELNKGLTPEVKSKIPGYLIQGLQGLSYIFERGYTHFDIRLENFFIHEGKALIGDLANLKRSDRGLPETLAPTYEISEEEKEYYKENGTVSYDLYCLGQQLQRLATILSPCEDRETKNFCETLTVLASCLTDEDPVKRPNIEQIITILKCFA